MSAKIKEKITQIAGENRQFGGNQLFIDLIPKSCWFTSIRSSIVKSDWDRIRKYVYQRVDNKCECCKSSENLEAHQRWLYDQEQTTQKLMRIVALCKKCHFSTHMGRAKLIGMGDQAKKHLMQVNDWTQEKFKQHQIQAFALWRERNIKKWKLDLQIVNRLGLRLTKKAQQSLDAELLNKNKQCLNKEQDKNSHLVNKQQYEQQQLQ